MIANELIDNFDSELKEYFLSSSENWKEKYKKSIDSIYHDEPWLTLIACYFLFGNQKKIDSKQIKALNGVLNSAGLSNKICFNSILKVRVEKKLPVIQLYKEYMKKSLLKENFHLYPDRKIIINTKLQKENSNFEGNTNLDLFIEGVSNFKKTSLFIEAKFLSDISYQITYNPVRDQIIRNIDCGIEYVKSKKYVERFEDFYFLLLTPKIFRTKIFGGSKNSELLKFGSTSSRLYCYKMDEYKDFNKLKELLPHRNLTDIEWMAISNNIGWITFEDILHYGEFNSTSDNNKNKMIKAFFQERNLI